MYALFIAVGNAPDDLAIGIVNQELGEYNNCIDYVNDNNKVGGYLEGGNRTCMYSSLGCKFAEQIQSTIPNHVNTNFE